MAAPYSNDLRLKVLGAYDLGFPTHTIAKMFSISRSWARRVKQRRREKGEVEARPMGGRRTCKIDRARLAELVKQQPDATLTELRERIEVQCSASGINKALKSLDLTFKKRRSTRLNKIGPMSRNAARTGRVGPRRLMPVA